VEQTVHRSDADEGAEVDDLDDLAVDDLLHLRIVGERVELSLEEDTLLTGQDGAVADILHLDDRDDRADVLVHSTFEFVLQELLHEVRRHLCEMPGAVPPPCRVV